MARPVHAVDQTDALGVTIGYENPNRKRAVCHGATYRYPVTIAQRGPLNYEATCTSI